jgi:glycoprotein endo-alpha-1,2-mannosidase
MRRILSWLILLAILTAGCSLIPSSQSGKLIVTPPQVENPEPEDQESPAQTSDSSDNWPVVEGPQPSTRVAAFYYPWYRNPENDGHWDHWGNLAPEDIASDYYPVLGTYSISDPAVLAQHFAWLREAGVGLIISSWWGRYDPTDRALPLMLDIADQYGIKVTFHIENYSGRNVNRLVQDIHYLYSTYGDHPAFYWTRETSLYSPGDQTKGLFFLWASSAPDGDSPSVSPDYWKEALDTMHGENPGAIVITDQNDPSWVTESHFDGAYNYGVLDADQVGYRWALGLPGGAWYVPGINPGFSANRIGYESWVDTPRREGETYRDRWERMFEVGIEPAMVVITTFNEWHEGTQIEPAVPGMERSGAYPYLDYESMPPEGYLELTREWSEVFPDHEWPESTTLRVSFRTTSDWTDLHLLSGAAWARPQLIEESEGLERAAMYDGILALGQPLASAEAGLSVRALFEIQFRELKEGPLIFQIERGGLGATWVELYRQEGEEWVLVDSFSWAGWSGGDRNTAEFEVPREAVFGPE